MFPLFETIAIAHGQALNLARHQARYEQSLKAFYGKNAVKIYDLAAQIQLPVELNEPLVRCRIDYDDQQLQIQYFPYARKSYRHFQPVSCDHIDYALKYADRSLLNQLLAQRGSADEIMIIKEGLVTDCSIGNLILRQGNRWFTPDTPLLAGTQRAALLASGQIMEKRIYAKDLLQYQEIRLINALNPLLP